MHLRLVHTSDWHLGHTLHTRERDAEHAAFLDWLVQAAVQVDAHALLVAGDVFDTANPSARAQSAYYGFLRRLRGALPAVQIVVVGGNHDSGGRLDAPRALLDELGVHVVGVVPRRDDGALDVDRLVIPLRGDGGHVAAWLVAMPYIRPQDLPFTALASPEATRAAIGELYAQALAVAHARRAPDQAVVATGHAYFANGLASADSERKVQMGNEAALPAEAFAESVQYLALGHLHLAQKVGGHPHLRYCGSPIPLGLDERHYPHQVLSVTLAGPAPAQVQPLPVPRAVPILRVPERGTAPLAEVLAALRQLPARAPDTPVDTLPYLDIAVLEPARVPDLRAQIDAALDGRAAWLVRLTDASPRVLGGAATAGGATSLAAADPERLFLDFWQLKRGQPPDEAVMACFRELLEATQAGEGA